MATRAPLISLLIAYGAFVTIGLPDGALNIAWSYMDDTFGVPFEWLGVLLLFVMAGRLTSSFAAGRLIAAVGIRGVLIGGASLVALGFFGIGTAPTWEMLLVSVVLTWMGSGALDASLNTVVSANYSVGRLNWLHAAFGVGATAGPALMTALITTMGAEWRVGYLLMIAPALGVVGLFIATPKGWHVQPASGIGTARADTAGVGETLRSPLVLLGMAIFFAYGGAEIGTGQLANPLLMDGRGVDQETAGFWITLYWGLFTLGRIIMGVVADKVPITLLLRASMIGALIGAGLLWANPTNAVGFIGLALMGFSFAPMFAALIAETPRRVGARLAANAIGFQVGMAGLGGAVLPGIAAVLVTGMGAEIIAPVAFTITLAVLIIHEVMLRYERGALMAAQAAGD